MHDMAAPGVSRLLDGLAPSPWIADKDHIDRGMITAHKKPPTVNSTGPPRRRTGASVSIRQAEREGHRPHQVMENPPAPTKSISISPRSASTNR